MALFLRLWRLEGTVDRPSYFAAGVAGFAVKYVVDWLIASVGFGHRWSPHGYWRLVRFDEAGPAAVTPTMFLTLLAASLPFLWFAMAMTLLRLRDAGRSAGWAALLFVPVVNVLLFAVLCVLPPARGRRAGDISGVMASALFAVIASVALATLAIGLSTKVLASYGVGLFVAVPFTVGYLAAFLHGRRYPAAGVQPFVIAFLSLVLLGGFLLAIAWEGLACLIMSAPLALAAAFIGAYFGGRMAGTAAHSGGATGSYFVIAALPVLLIGESVLPRTVPTYRVDTRILIDAPIERVWSNVVSFPDITAPPAWYFRAGIAAPVGARIVGRGAGAMRYCEFTTGTFVEPIRIWDEPRLLAFDVASNPPPMRELSPWGDIEPEHLSGFLVSKQGQFSLRTVDGGRTEVVGTTWYQHHLWPAGYWAAWSNAIIHRIHLRVLAHIKDVSEGAQRTSKKPD